MTEELRRIEARLFTCMENLIEQAIAQERERCAALADAAMQEAERISPIFAQHDPIYKRLQARAGMARQLAKQIRTASGEALQTPIRIAILAERDACSQAAHRRGLQIALLHPGCHVDPAWLGDEIRQTILDRNRS